MSTEQQRAYGCINVSTACHESKRIHILSGPSKDTAGRVSRIDKRGRTGQVTVKFN